MGTALYYTKSGQAGLWRLGVHDGIETQVLTTLQPYDWGGWALGEDVLYFVERTPRMETPLKRLNLVTGDTTEVARFDGYLMWHQNNLALAPDGQTLLYTNIDQSESDIVLLDGLP